MHRTVATWEEVGDAFQGVHNFLMAEGCVPFAFDFPPFERIVDELRHDRQARITRGQTESALDGTDIAQAFRALPIDAAMREPFALAHFELHRFYDPGQVFHGFEQAVMDPWREALRRAGFTWARCYPICFISGGGCKTGYHMDMSHVIAWQIYGTKRFVGYRQPDRWAPQSVRHEFLARGTAAVVRPRELTPEDELVYVMHPGDVLWNIVLTPHLVSASDKPACSINLSHRGVRLHGKLCNLELEHRDWAAAHGHELPF